ncbi:MAG: hypothetical protein HYU87_10985 [Chloroflexi bacterium]|nr:hypothetical protein [Chloroflexota bacterium]
MPPRAPVIWTSAATRGDRIRKRLDERHRDLSRDAKALGVRYRGSRAAASSPEGTRLRADFLASLGRLSAFESASLSLSRCRYELQVTVYADDLSRDYFQLWQMLARRGSEPRSDDESSAERMDHFAVQVGRLEGIADALLIAGRNVRLFPPPNVAWMPLTTT